MYRAAGQLTSNPAQMPGDAPAQAIGREGIVIRRVRLEMARCHEFPEDSEDHGYELSLPLGPKGYLDHDHWMRQRKEAVFHRFWGGEEQHGQLRHGREGWTLAFTDGAGGKEVIFKGDRHRFIEGEYVSIRESDGITRTFRVAAVRAAPPMPR